MGFKTKQQLIAYLQNLSASDIAKLGLPVAEASAIMRHSNKSTPYITNNRMFPRLASKYLTLQIVGHAFVQPEAIDHGYLCQGYRLLLIKNYQLFKKCIIMAEKKVIKSVFQLLDERWLSRRYRLCYQYDEDKEKDLIDCITLIGDRLHFHSVQIYQSLLPVFSQFRPIKIKISDCSNISQLFEHIPRSVAELTLYLDSLNTLSFEGVCGGVRKFRKLNLFKCKIYLKILSGFATATETLTIEEESLAEPGVIEFLTQMDCKQIIVSTKNLEDQNLRQFFHCQSKAIKLIQFNQHIYYSQIGLVEWAFKYFTRKCLEKCIQIHMESQIDDLKVFFETLFNGPLKLFKNKNISLYQDFTINYNVCLPIADIHTQSLFTDSLGMAVLALNNCRGLSKLEIGNYEEDCIYQELKVEKLQLQELIIDIDDDIRIPLVSDIVKKSKDTLSSLKCTANSDLSQLRNSTALKILRIGRNIDDVNLEVFRTFDNLEELETVDQMIVSQFNSCQSLKKIISNGYLYQQFDFPQSVTTMSIYFGSTLNKITEFLERNPFVKEIEARVKNNEAAQLLEKFQHVKFCFDFDRMQFFSFKKCYDYLNPECKQIGIPASEPDHILYDLLFKRLPQRESLLVPYLKADLIKGYYTNELIESIRNISPEWMEQLSSFNEFKNCLRQDKLDAAYFDKVFNHQITNSTDAQYLHIIVSAYDEVFKLQADIQKTVIILKAMTSQERKSIKRETFFHQCRNNWMQPLTYEDLKTI
ncbi:hypothetical protein FGO68_gene10285 [Halteria grandinella]|uniref:Uncharacterized protein n=1 Tax=Halteria grandinella TaxID=5974 RepID=A0A8J8T6I6_HALGN|nr:hypothetical protein FGO68_gene10285 [Halteria grandinella]